MRGFSFKGLSAQPKAYCNELKRLTLEDPGSGDTRLLDSHCHTCKPLTGLSTWRGGEEVVKRDKAQCLSWRDSWHADRSQAVLWVLVREVQQTRLFPPVAVQTCSADSNNSLSLSANEATTTITVQRADLGRGRGPFLGLFYSEWNHALAPWELTLFTELSGGSKGVEVRFSAETSEPSCSLNHSLLLSLSKPAASAPSSPSQK